MEIFNQVTTKSDAFCDAVVALCDTEKNPDEIVHRGLVSGENRKLQKLPFPYSYFVLPSRTRYGSLVFGNCNAASSKV